MEKKILNEINDMRVKMGLPILNENSILLSEAGVISTLVGKITGELVTKNALTTVEKGLLTKFVAGTLKGTEKSEFKTLINSTKGLKFIKEFENAIASETNLLTKTKAQAYLDNNIKPRLNTTVGGRPGTGKPPTTAPAGKSYNNSLTPAQIKQIEKETKELSDSISDLRDIVFNFQRNEKIEILKDPQLMGYVNEAKKLLEKIKNKDSLLKTLPTLQVADFRALESVIKGKSPTLWTHIGLFMKKYPKISVAAIIVLILRLYIYVSIYKLFPLTCIQKFDHPHLIEVNHFDRGQEPKRVLIGNMM
jgi:hypothetical protein